MSHQGTSRRSQSPYDSNIDNDIRLYRERNNFDAPDYVTPSRHHRSSRYHPYEQLPTGKFSVYMHVQLKLIQCMNVDSDREDEREAFDGLALVIRKLVNRVLAVENVLKSVKDTISQQERSADSSRKKKIPLVVRVRKLNYNILLRTP